MLSHALAPDMPPDDGDFFGAPKLNADDACFFCCCATTSLSSSSLSTGFDGAELSHALAPAIDVLFDAVGFDATPNENLAGDVAATGDVVAIGLSADFVVVSFDPNVNFDTPGFVAAVVLVAAGGAAALLVSLVVVVARFDKHVLHIDAVPGFLPSQLVQIHEEDGDAVVGLAAGDDDDSAFEAAAGAELDAVSTTFFCIGEPNANLEAGFESSLFAVVVPKLPNENVDLGASFLSLVVVFAATGDDDDIVAAFVAPNENADFDASLLPNENADAVLDDVFAFVVVSTDGDEAGNVLLTAGVSNVKRRTAGVVGGIFTATGGLVGTSTAVAAVSLLLGSTPANSSAACARNNAN